MRHIYLIGYRGSGKSSVAKALSNKLDIPSIDSDDCIEEQAGKTIKEIFADDGEPGFRKLESEVLQSIANEESIRIVSLGGGAILASDNRIIIKDGYTIWLAASAETLTDRILGDATSEDRRPRLTQHDDLLQEVSSVLSSRLPLYEECAGFTLNTQSKTLDQITEEIMLWLRSVSADLPNSTKL